MKRKFLFRLFASTMTFCFLALGMNPIAAIKKSEISQEVESPYGPTPTELQLNYQKEELTSFIHFGMNTFTGSEWGNGKESPSLFNPTELDADQWIKTLYDVGFKKVILTAKHHDGFCLWPTKTTEHDVSNSPWKDGKGDVVKEVSKACEKYGLKFGLYLSPWDQNSKDYGEGNGGDYNDFYVEQLTELLENYGEISEIWMDGAKGSNVVQEYDFERWFKLIKEKQPNCIIWSQVGPDARWIGNESGYAGEPCWSTIDIAKMKEKEVPSYLNTGEENGPDWVVGESDVSIRPGWFYHANQDNDVKSLEKLMDIYFKSVGRNSVLLLNIPPDKRGKFHENDVQRIKEFGDAIKGTFDENLALGSKILAENVAGNNEKFSGDKVIDYNYDTYWAPNNENKTGSLEIDLGEEKEFDIVSLQEYIPLGQRVAEFDIEVFENNEWSKVFSGKTIGYKRLVRIPPTTASKVRINIKRSLATPLINNIGIYKQPMDIELPSGPPAGLDFLNDGNKGSAIGEFNFSNGWVYETLDRDREGDSHYTTTTGATINIKFNGSKFYLSGAKDPKHGIAEISIDGGEVVEVDTYAQSRINQSILYESEDLEDGEHEVTIRCTGRKNTNSGGTAIHTDGAFALNNGGKGMFEMEKLSYTVKENIGKAVFKVVRKGGSKGRAEINYETLPGTALNAKDYQTWSGTLAFNEGETEKTFEVNIIDNKDLEESRYFFVKLSDPIGGAILGFDKQSKVTIEDDELIKIETADTGDGLHKFNLSNGWSQEKGGMWTKDMNANFTIKFVGRKISLVGAKDPNHGVFQISIDGGEYVDIDQYAENRETNATIFESKELEYGEHTLSYRLKGENPHGGRSDGQINYALVDSSIVESEINGDFNANGKYDIGDLSIVSKHYGQNKPEYDLNKDNVIDEFEVNFITNKILE
ncbi:alpha-L-fucosidase [Clostridium chauvoei]|uniref:alpha-L-fucosidase n=1 Tax=Clostridium chauvoei TaxID=46867 RepID=UPI001C863FD8|nr:alpha-L-fucosidase [Clostridium chauvoei]MBX7375766.1 alpha-L-fucosidase [Clostridium chauvoei]MBX7388541.1 alpha-L-fucosidase [Clostridium chauvoei]